VITWRLVTLGKEASQTTRAQLRAFVRHCRYCCLSRQRKESPI
jgi:hypothetical protein